MNKPEDLTRKVFLHLRSLGPVSNADLAARLEVPTSTTYSSLQKLQGKGLAQQKPLGLWDITWLGRIWFRWEVKNQKRKAVHHDPNDIELTKPRRLQDPKGGDPAEWPADLRIQEFPQ